METVGGFYCQSMISASLAFESVAKPVGQQGGPSCIREEADELASVS